MLSETNVSIPDPSNVAVSTVSWRMVSVSELSVISLLQAFKLNTSIEAIRVDLRIKFFMVMSFRKILHRNLPML